MSCFKKNELIDECCKQIVELVKNEPDPFTGDIDVNKIKIIICDTLDIWPADIANDPQSE